jgi:hypothetical protein
MQRSSHDVVKRFGKIILKGIARRLYSPEPIGIGTPMVESLTSYIVRLASAHCVKTGTLIVSEIAPLIGKNYLTDMSSLCMSGPFMYTARSVNGVGVTAEDWLSALQVLNLRQELRFLTMLPWKELVNDIKLLRRTRAWCPNCYEEWHQEEKPIYDPLLWSLEAVIVCPNHKRFLREKCVQCKKQHPALPRFSLPGFCPYCNLWLGNSSSNVSDEDAILTDKQLDWQRYLVNQLGDVFTAIYQGTSLPRQLAADVISTCVQRTTRGDLKTFVSRFSSACYATIHNWLNKSKPPQIGSLIEICYRTGVPIKEVLCRERNADVIPPEFAPIRSKDAYYLTQVAS